MSGALNTVPFVSVERMMRLVHEIGVERFLVDLAAQIEQDFRRWESFDKTARIASHSPAGVIELMPASDGRLYGFKYVNGHPSNVGGGLQTVTAFGLLADVATGYPILLSEMTLLTALRTAAMSALAARYLAPAGASCMALIGNGAQSEFQALAFRALLGVGSLRLFDVDEAATAKCAGNLRRLGFQVACCASGAAAVEGAQVITTVTADKRRATVLSDNMVGQGVHINGVGGDCPGKTEIDVRVLERSRIFVEYTPQTRIEGDIQQLPPDHPVEELWRVFDGKAPGRTDAREVTVFDSVGFAIEDFSALRYVYREAMRTGLYDPLDMIADPDDPRDLFGMLARHAGPVAAA